MSALFQIYLYSRIAIIHHSAARFSFFRKRETLWLGVANPLPQGNPLYSIHFAKDKETGFAVGADSTVLRTENGGFNWKSQIMPFDVTLSGIFVKDKKRATIVGARGTIFSTDDGGKDWKQIATEAKDHLYGISFTGENLMTGWAVELTGGL